VAADGESGFDAFYMGDYSPERFYDPDSPIYTSPVNINADPERPLSDWMGNQTIRSIFHQLPKGDFRLTLTFYYWYTEYICEIVVYGTYSPPPSNPATYWLTSTSDLRGHKLVNSQPNGPARSGLVNMEFRTDPFTDPASIQSGQVTVYFYATNSSDNPGTVGLILKPSSGIPAIGIGAVDIPANTTNPTLFSSTFHTNTYNFADGNRLVLVFISEATIRIHWDGEWNVSRVIIPPLSQ